MIMHRLHAPTSDVCIFMVGITLVGEFNGAGWGVSVVVKAYIHGNGCRCVVLLAFFGGQTLLAGACVFDGFLL